MGFSTISIKKFECFKYIWNWDWMQCNSKQDCDLWKGSFMAIPQRQVKDGPRTAKQRKMDEQLCECLHYSTSAFSCLIWGLYGFNRILSIRQSRNSWPYFQLKIYKLQLYKKIFLKNPVFLHFTSFSLSHGPKNSFKQLDQSIKIHSVSDKAV